MKAFYLFFLVLLAAFACKAQTKGTIKLYGYKQKVSQGKAPDILEGSNEAPMGRTGTNYFIYAVSPARIYPSEMWIEGTRYGVSVRTITRTPVEHTNAMVRTEEKKVLVPKTSQKVIQLTPVPAGASKASSQKAPSLAASNELVILYKMNGKFYYKTLKHLSELEHAAAQ